MESRTKIIINGLIGNNKITAVIIPKCKINEEYLNKNKENPHQNWRVSKVIDGFIISETKENDTWKITKIQALNTFRDT